MLPTVILVSAILLAMTLVSLIVGRAIRRVDEEQS